MTTGTFNRGLLEFLHNLGLLASLDRENMIHGRLMAILIEIGICLQLLIIE